MKQILFAAIVLAWFAGVEPARAVDAAAFDTAVLDARVEAMLQEWDQPGIAIAIVENGRIVHERGFGVRSLESKQPVDAQTLFGIASLSKSFAAATVARLVGEGRLAWDAPVTRYLPDFRMPRERDTDEVTLRDLLTMRSGIGSSEYTFRRVSRDRQDQVRRIRFLPQLHPLRSEFLYTTDSYTALGEVVATVTGEPWDRYAAETLWQPLGMFRTDADSRVARVDVNAASPHITDNGRRRAIEWVYEDDTALPAGGVNSSAHDMALWLLFQLGEGRIGGRSLLSADALRETHIAQTPLRGPMPQTSGPPLPAMARIACVIAVMQWVGSFMTTAATRCSLTPAASTASAARSPFCQRTASASWPSRTPMRASCRSRCCK